MIMPEGILESVKIPLGLDMSDDSFDVDIVTFINGTITTLTNFGIGPPDGFSITGPDEVWSDFIGTSKKVESVKTLLVLKVRLLFDPPANSTILDAVKSQIAEMEWRINAAVESGDYAYTQATP